MDSGWHPDPSGKHELRFWDGERWTDHVSSSGQQRRDPLPVADPFSSTPQTPQPGSPPPGSFSPGPFAPGPNLLSGWGMSAARASEHPEGTTIMVLGILSLVICGLLGPFAWVKGNRAMAEMNSQPHTIWTNRGQVRAGQICGIVSSCLLMFGAAIMVLALAVAASSSN